MDTQVKGQDLFGRVGTYLAVKTVYLFKRHLHDLMIDARVFVAWFRSKA